MKLINQIVAFIDGKDYQSLSKEEKAEFINEKYWANHDVYLFLSGAFFLIEVMLYFLLYYGILHISKQYHKIYTVTLIASGLSFGLLTVLYLIEKRTNQKYIKKMHIDLFIAIALIGFVFMFTTTQAESDCQQIVYAIVIMLYVFLLKVRPIFSAGLFFVMYSSMILYTNYLEMDYGVKLGLLVNCLILNLLGIYLNRYIFTKSIQDYIHRKTILKQNRELEYFALHDHLTGLENIRSLDNKKKDQDIKIPAVICVFDLDGLKLFNDAFGHAKGDSAIKLVGNKLKKYFKNDFKARIGGDEFVVVCENETLEPVKEKIDLLVNDLGNTKISGIGVSVSVGYKELSCKSEITAVLRYAENMMYHSKLSRRAARKNYAMEMLYSALYNHTKETQRHCYYVSVISQAILEQYGYNMTENQDAIKVAGMLHDIGKLLIPAYILHKKSPLNEQERENLRQHSEKGYKIVSGIIDDYRITEAVLYHHENFDGTGYPMGLKGKEIPLFARIISIADSFDAMVSKRAYADKKDLNDARDEIERCAGTQFDPDIVASFLSISLNALPY